MSTTDPKMENLIFCLCSQHYKTNIKISNPYLAQSSGAVEYTDCFSAEA